MTVEWRLTLALLLASAAAQAPGYGSGGGAYEAELRRRQLELAQAQALRQQQAQQAAYAQQAQQQRGGQQQSYQQQQAYQQALRAQQQQQAMQAAQQQMMREQVMREAALRAQSGGSASGTKGRPLSKKEKQQQMKQQAAAKKQAEAASKANKAAATQRQKQFAQAQRAASKRQGAGGVRPRRGGEGKGPLGFVLSVKGALLFGGIGYLYVAQREVLFRLLGLILKYPIMVASLIMRKAWDLLLKPVLRKVIQLRGSSGSVGAAAASLASTAACFPVVRTDGQRTPRPEIASARGDARAHAGARGIAEHGVVGATNGAEPEAASRVCAPAVGIEALGQRARLTGSGPWEIRSPAAHGTPRVAPGVEQHGVRHTAF